MEIWFKAILKVVLIFSCGHNIEQDCIIIYEMAMTSTLESRSRFLFILIHFVGHGKKLNPTHLLYVNLFP